MLNEKQNHIADRLRPKQKQCERRKKLQQIKPDKIIENMAMKTTHITVIIIIIIIQPERGRDVKSGIRERNYAYVSGKLWYRNCGCVAFK